MFQYFLKRLVLACITLFFITFIVYGLVRAMPGSPVMLEEGFDPNRSMSEADRKEREKYFALDKPWYVGYFIWAGRLSPVALQVQEKAPFIRWPIIRFKSMDLGMSSREKTPVLNSIAQRLGPTLQLSIASLLITYMLSIPIGLYSSVHRGQKRERVLSLFLYGLYSFPSFVAALLLLLVFYQNMPWDWLKLEPGLHSANYESLSFFGKLGDNFKHMFLPTLCYSYGSLAYLSRFIKSNMEEVVRQDYIRTARAKGVSPRNVTLHHAFRNTLIPFVTLLGMSLPGLVGGSVILENIFRWPGIGQLFLDAITWRDHFLIMGLVLMFSTLTLLGQLLADMLYSVVDPRVIVK
ncbi:MAG: ABC transporter permease [Thermoguttaceae bacterium]|nr:ABC transporter permease [Thermoguttaceae bacterium]MBQ6616888.1 ABC transporter permease [Thermoguttaceae bacterium]